MNTKLARYFSAQSWGGATIAEQAMEKMVDPTLTKPLMPSLTKEFETTEVQQLPDPDNEGQLMDTKVPVTRVRYVNPAVLTTLMAKYMLVYKI